MVRAFFLPEGNTPQGGGGGRGTTGMWIVGRDKHSAMLGTVSARKIFFVLNLNSSSIVKH